MGETFPFDLRMLKSFRWLRPLKMVSKVPSKFQVVTEYSRTRDYKAIFAPEGIRN